MKLPNFLVIGAQKAGSTWVYDRLKEHPSVFMPDRVELLHFNRTSCRDPDSVAPYAKNFEDVRPEHVWIGEKTPGYFWSAASGRFENQPGPGHNRNIPHDVRELLGPDVRLVISLRHPIARAISAYAHHGKRRRIKPGETLSDVADRYGIVDMGFYDAHLEAWEKFFPDEQIEILIFEEDIKENPSVALGRLSVFLGIDPNGFPVAENPRSNPGVARKVLNREIRFSVEGLAPVRLSDVALLLDEYDRTLQKLGERFGDRMVAWADLTHQYEEFAGGA